MLRRPSIILWLATYTAIALCGSALHELTGCGHDRRETAAWCDADPGLRADPSSPTVSATADEEAHCPVCLHLAQAQAAPAARPTVAISGLDLAPEEVGPTGPRPAPPLRSRPRAPPRPTSARD